ncbi:MAG: rane-associated protein [Actinomycetota bacterium]|jgi:undecaprenyl-diphosphatase|nr:rane-associated protein [Actinomycetota bacterium]
MGSLVGHLLTLSPWAVLLAVFLLPALEASTFVGLVVPAESAVVVGGFLAHSGHLPLYLVVLAASAGAIAGDQVGYWVGRRFGPGLLERLPGRLRSSDRLRGSLDLVARRGGTAVFIGRWAASLRAVTPTIAGMSGVEPRRFAIANAVGATTWAVTAAMLGYLVGASYRSVLSRLSLTGTLVVGLLVLLALARWWHLRRGTRRASGTKAA